MNLFITYLIASFLTWCILVAFCVIYDGVNRKTWRQEKNQEQSKSFAERVSDYRAEEQAKQEDPLARIHPIEWNTETREVIDLKYTEC